MRKKNVYNFPIWKVNRNESRPPKKKNLKWKKLGSKIAYLNRKWNCVEWWQQKSLMQFWKTVFIKWHRKSLSHSHEHSRRIITDAILYAFRLAQWNSFSLFCIPLHFPQYCGIKIMNVIVMAVVLIVTTSTAKLSE